jgi:hypothetical protein
MFQPYKAIFRQHLFKDSNLLGPFLWRLVALRVQIPVPTPIPQFSNRHYCGFFFGDFLLLPYGLPFFWICLQIRGIRLSKAGHFGLVRFHLVLNGFHFSLPFSSFGVPLGE